MIERFTINKEIKKFSNTKDTYRINEKIRSDKIRLIGEDGKHIGIFTRVVALNMAKKDNYDLVEIQSNTYPTVCQIMDYYKFLYNKKKKEKISYKNTNIPPKEIKIRPNIEEYDYLIKLKRIINFLKKNKNVKISIRFRGREMIYKDYGLKLLEKIKKDITNIGLMLFIKKNIDNKQIYLLVQPKVEQKKNK